MLLAADAAGGAGLVQALHAVPGGPFRALQVRDLDEALASLSAARYDAVLVHQHVADRSGGRALERLRRAAGDAPVLVLAEQAPPGAYGWIPAGQPAEAVAARVAAEVERRRLRAELQRTREALELSEARFRSIIQRAADGIVIVGEDGVIRFVNPAAEGLFGRPAAELAGQEFGFAVMAGEATEIDLLRRGGEPLVVELRASLTAWDGEPAQVISLRDVTDRRHADERARVLLLEQAARAEAERATRRARLLAEAGATLDAFLDPAAALRRLAELLVPRMADWCVIDLLEGGRLRRVAGVHADPDRQPLLDELLGRYPVHAESPQPAARVVRSGVGTLWRDLTPARLRELTVDGAHARLLRRVGAHSVMAVPLGAHGARLGAVTLFCAERNFEAEDLGLAGEIAQRAAQAVENARLYEAALAASRAKSDFLAVMSHELRTPLNAVLGYTQLLLDGVPAAVEGAHVRYLGAIDAAARHLLEIIEEILHYVQLEAGSREIELRPVRLRALIDEIAAVAGPLVRERGLEFRASVPTRDAELCSDPGKVQRIALNLLTNAAKFTREGRVELRAEVVGGELVLEVADTGPGIPAASLERVFEGFWVAERPLVRRAGGTGVGLRVARALAELLGGTLTAASEEGVGSVFTLRIPARLPGDCPG